MYKFISVAAAGRLQNSGRDQQKLSENFNPLELLLISSNFQKILIVSNKFQVLVSFILHVFVALKSFILLETVKSELCTSYDYNIKSLILNL